MIEQRHPSERVTPVEVGDRIRWTPDENGKDHHGTTDARGCRYLVGPLDDVFVAVVVTRVLGHGGQCDHHVTLRHVQTLEAAQQVCQDEEHRRAWSLLSDTAKRLLQGAQVVEA